MTRTQLAAAVALAAGGLASPVFAAGSSVQLYGLIDLGVSHFSNGSAGETKMSTGGESGSRIGVRGREALGGGVQAFFQVETGFCANGSPDKSGYCSGGSFMGRTSQLGLKGPLGTLQMGRMYTLAFHDQVAVDPFHYGTMGDIANIGLAGSYSTVPPRFSQAVEYVTPRFGPWSAAAEYQFGAGEKFPAGTSTTGGYDLHLGYRSGPGFANLDYLRVNKSTGGAVSRHAMLSGGYDFGPATLTAMLARNHPDDGLGDDLRVELLGLAVPVGRGDVLASYTRLSDQTLADHGARKFAVGYTYAFSRNVNLYASYATIRNDSGVFHAVNDSSNNSDLPAGADGATSTGFDLGLRTKF